MAGLAVFTVIGLCFAPGIVAAFRRDDLEVIRIGAFALRLQCAVFPLMGWALICNMLSQNIGAFISAAVLAFVRQGVFFLPLILILPRVAGLPGVMYAQPIADVLTFLIAIPIGLSVVNRIKKEMAEAASQAANSNTGNSGNTVNPGSLGSHVIS
jgi:Na+-driven multidrug efflux pump